MSTLNIKQLRGKNLLVNVLASEEDGVLVPDGVNQGTSHNIAEVILVGDEINSNIPYDYVVGDRVMIRSMNRGRKYEVNGGEYTLLPETDVIAVVD